METASSEDQFERRGLSWVMALARVELGAMLATFTGMPEPFAATSPSVYEAAAYKSLLLDGIRMHYWSLYRDPGLRKVTNSVQISPMTLSYVRRLTLARSMLLATMKTGFGSYTPYQLRELTSWKNDLDEFQAGLVTIVEAYLAQSRSVSREYVEACANLLNAERKELSAGTAKVYKIK